MKPCHRRALRHDLLDGSLHVLTSNGTDFHAARFAVAHQIRRTWSTGLPVDLLVVVVSQRPIAFTDGRCAGFKPEVSTIRGENPARETGGWGFRFQTGKPPRTLHHAEAPRQMTFAEELRAWRRSHRLTRREAALILGVAGRPSPSTIGKWERTERRPPPVKEARIRARMTAYVPASMEEPPRNASGG